jgi:hypothetical protein
MPQADYTVSASQSGSAYASDVNDALLAIQTNNSGSTAPPDLDAFMGWADTTTNFFKTRDAGNTTWYTQYPLNKSLSTYINELVLVHGLGGTAPLKSGDDLNSVDQTGFYRITTGTTNNTYGNGSVLVVNRGSGVVDQLILSITDSKLYLRNTANNGSLWTLKATMGDAPTLNSLLPSQTGNAGKLLTTDGTNASWGNVPFAYVNFDGTTAANLTGTFTRTLTTVTVNVTGHGHLVGHRISFVGAGIASDWYTVVSVVDANTFTFTTVASGAIGSTVCTLNRRSIRKAVNVQSVIYSPTASGEFAVNFSTLATGTNYCIAKDYSVNTGNLNGNIFAESHGSGSVYYAPTTAYFHLRTIQNASGLVNLLYNNITIFP